MKDIDWKFETDVTDKFRNDSSGHSYKELYEVTLPRSKRVLEIGIQEGGFVSFCKHHMPKDFFMVGCDVDKLDDARVDLLDDMYVGDAYTDEFLEWIYSNGYQNSFDLVIDDGPHTLDSQIWAIRNCGYLLADGGVFICEDVQEIGWVDVLMKESKFPDETFVLDNRKVYGRYDDIAVVVDRKNVFGRFDNA